MKKIRLYELLGLMLTAILLLTPLLSAPAKAAAPAGTALDGTTLNKSRWNLGSGTCYLAEDLIEKRYISEIACSPGIKINGPIPQENAPVAVTGTSSKDYSAYFSGDKEEYLAANGENNVVRLSALLSHEHDWSFTSTEDSVTAACSNTQCSYHDGLTLTLTVPSGVVYDEQSHPASFTGDDNWKTAGFTVPEITYQMQNGDIWEEIGDTPTEMGKYRALAKIAAGGKAYTLVKEYEITANTYFITLTSASATKVYDGTPLTASTVTVTAGAFDAGDSFSATCTGSMTDVGVANNLFTYTVTPSSSASKYTVTQAYGTLEITAPPSAGARVDSDALREVLESWEKEIPDETVSVTMKISEEISEEDMQALAPKTEGRNALYHDATLEVTVDGEKQIGAGNDVLIDVTYKFDFFGKANVQVFRVHEDSVDELTAIPNEEGEKIDLNTKAGTVTVTANKYSAYAIVYDDAPEPIPKTGDNSPIALMAGLLALSGISLVVLKKRAVR